MGKAFTRVCTTVCAGVLLLGAAQAQAPAAQTPAAPEPGFRVVYDHTFTPLTLLAKVQLNQSLLDLPAGICTGVHLHSGPGIETVLSGEVMVQTKAPATTPASTQTYKTGEAYLYPAGDIHHFCNMTKLSATYMSAFLLPGGAVPVTPVSSPSAPGRQTALEWPTAL